MNPEQQYYEVEEFWSPDQETEIDRARHRHVAGRIPAGTGSLLDVGCGNGSLLRHLRNTRPELVLHGFDRSAAALRHVDTPHAIGDITALPFSPRQFDCITACEVLEHLPAPVFARALSELSRVAAHTIVITVPAGERLSANQVECPECRSRFNANLHLRSFTESSLRGMLVPCGFAAADVSPMLSAAVYPGLATALRIKRRRAPRANYFPHPIPCAVCGTAIPSAEPASTGGAGPASTSSIDSRTTSAPRLIDRLLARCWPHHLQPRWFIATYHRLAST